MKILVIHNHYLERGGEDEVVESEIKMLKKFGHDVFFYSRSNNEIKECSLCQKIKFLIKDIFWSKKTYRDIKEIVLREKPDIAHIHNIFVVISPSVYSALRETGVPIVQTLHNYRFFCPQGIFYRNGKICRDCFAGKYIPSVLHKCWRDSFILSFFFAGMLLFHFKKKTFYNKIDAFIVLTESSRNRFIELGIPEDRIFVKPNFADFRAGKKKKNEKYAVFIGRLVEYKGINTLIAAFFKIQDCHIKIIGAGPLYGEIKDKLKGVTNIELLGRLPLEKTLEYLNNASFLVFPSECYENMPRVILEAFACATAVIGADLGAMAEIINDGITGLLFKAGNSEELALKVRFLWNDDRLCEMMGENARRLFENKYTADKNVAQLRDVYDKVRRFGWPLV